MEKLDVIASFDWMDKEENIGIPRREIKYFSERFEKGMERGT